MKKKISTFFIIFICFSISQTMLATNRTTEDENQYNVVRGEEEELLSYYHDTQSLCHTTLLRFDLSNAPKAGIQSVKLRLYGIAEPGGGTHPTTNRPTPEKHTIAVYNMNHNQKEWDESTFMYNHWEYYYGNPRTSDTRIALLTDISGEGWFEWDVTDGVVNSIKAGDQQLTLSLCNTSTMKSPESNENAYTRFHSKENKSGNIPVLSFTYDPTNIQTSLTEQYEYNITDRTLTVKPHHRQTQFIITDISGRRLYQAIGQETYSYTFLTKGIYIFSLQEGSNLQTQKLFIR